MTIVGAWRGGIQRVNGAPAILAGVWLMTAACALPFALSITVGPTPTMLVFGESIPGYFHTYFWWFQQIKFETIGPLSGVGSEIGAALAHPLTFVMNESRVMVGVTVGPLYFVAWLFLSGGIIDRYARNRATRAHGFFAASGVFFFRFIRLGIVMAASYGVIVYFLQQWPFAMWPALAACNLLFDYAQVRAVVEDRRSMLGALRAALSFIRRNWQGTLALYLIDLVLFAAVVAIYTVLGHGSFVLRFAITPLIWH